MVPVRSSWTSWPAAAVAAPGLAGAAAVLVGRPMVGAALTVLSASLAIRPRWHAVPRSVPLALVCCVAGVAFVAEVAGPVGLRPLAGGWSARLLLALFGVGTATAALLHRARSERRADMDESAGERPRVLWMAPAAFMGMLAFVPLIRGVGTSSGWVFGGDHVRHLVFIARTQQVGWLDYADTTYPRGWHASLAALWAAGGGQLDGRGFLTLGTIMAVSCWTSVAVVSLAVARCAVVLSGTMGAGGLGADLAGFVAGAVVLTPPFARDYLALGFETSVVAALCLTVSVLVVIDRTTRPVALVGAVASFFLVAHSWQLLLPGAAVSLVLVALRWWRGSSRRAAVAGLAAAGVAIVASAVPLLATAQFGGVGHGAVGGDLPMSATGWAVLGAAALLVLLLRHSGRPVVRRYAVVAAATAVVAPALALYVSVPLSSYYPNKTLWVTAVLLVPAAAAVWGALLGWADAAKGAGRLALVPLGVSTAIVVVLALASPVTGLRGAWSATDGGEVARAASAPGAARAQVFWSGGPYVFDATVQSLLPFYAAAEAGYDPSLPRDSLIDECRALEAVAAPVVLTTASELTTERRFSCAPGVVVVRVPR